MTFTSLHFQGLKGGACLTLGNEVSEGTPVLTEERIPGQRAVGQGYPRGLLCRMAWRLRFHGDGISFCVVLGQSF